MLLRIFFLSTVGVAGTEEKNALLNLYYDARLMTGIFRL